MNFLVLIVTAFSAMAAAIPPVVKIDEFSLTLQPLKKEKQRSETLADYI